MKKLSLLFFCLLAPFGLISQAEEVLKKVHLQTYMEQTVIGPEQHDVKSVFSIENSSGQKAFLSFDIITVKDVGTYLRFVVINKAARPQEYFWRDVQCQTPDGTTLRVETEEVGFALLSKAFTEDLSFVIDLATNTRCTTLEPDPTNVLTSSTLTTPKQWETRFHGKAGGYLGLYNLNKQEAILKFFSPNPESKELRVELRNFPLLSEDFGQMDKTIQCGWPDQNSYSITAKPGESTSISFDHEISKDFVNSIKCIMI